jgi:molybdopterin converting factor small subunit
VTTVRIPPTLRAEVSGEREIEADGANVREVLEGLASRFPELGNRIFENGEIVRFINVFVEGEDVRTREGLETPVPDGSTLILLPAMAGG